MKKFSEYSHTTRAIIGISGLAVFLFVAIFALRSARQDDLYAYEKVCDDLNYNTTEYLKNYLKDKITYSFVDCGATNLKNYNRCNFECNVGVKKEDNIKIIGFNCHLDKEGGRTYCSAK